jgi:short-subunit dehydrogenase
LATRRKNLILIARSESGLETVKTEILSEFPSLNIILRCVDLSASETCVALYDSLKEYPIETWINNAGVGYYGYIAEQDIGPIKNGGVGVERRI